MGYEQHISNVHSNDSSVNRFIDRFIRATLEGRYADFRQMWTRRLDPVSAEKYLAIWKVVREVRVLDVQPIRKPDRSIEAYLIKAEVQQDSGDLPRQRQTNVTRWIRVVREAGEWVFAPPEKNDRERVYGPPATQAASAPTAD